MGCAPSHPSPLAAPRPLLTCVLQRDADAHDEVSPGPQHRVRHLLETLRAPARPLPAPQQQVERPHRSHEHGQEHRRGQHPSRRAVAEGESEDPCGGRSAAVVFFGNVRKSRTYTRASMRPRGDRTENWNGMEDASHLMAPSRVAATRGARPRCSVRASDAQRRALQQSNAPAPMATLTIVNVVSVADSRGEGVRFIDISRARFAAPGARHPPPRPWAAAAAPATKWRCTCPNRPLRRSKPACQRNSQRLRRVLAKLRSILACRYSRLIAAHLQLPDARVDSARTAFATPIASSVTHPARPAPAEALFGQLVEAAQREICVDARD